MATDYTGQTYTIDPALLAALPSRTPAMNYFGAGAAPVLQSADPAYRQAIDAITRSLPTAPDGYEWDLTQQPGQATLIKKDSLVGTFLKDAAPIAASVIPGLGPLGAFALGAGGSAVGGALNHDQFNPVKTLIAGGIPALSQGLGLPSKVFGGGGAAASGAPTAANFGTAGMIGGGASAAPAVAAAAPAIAGAAAPAVAGSAAPAVAGGAAAAGAGTLGTIGKIGQIGLGIGSALSAGSAQGKANDAAQQAVNLAMQDYQNRAQFRSMALQGLQSPLPQAPNLTNIFADPGNPYYRAAPPIPMTGPVYSGFAPTGNAPQMTPGTLSTTTRPRLSP